MAISFVTASTGATDAGGAWSYTTSAPSAAGNIIIVQVLQDGVSSSSAITISSATNVENLAGTDNVFTTIASGQAVGSTLGYQYLFIGRALNTSAIVITGANSGADDIYVRAYEFSGVSLGTTLATVIENSTAGSFANGNALSTTCSDTGVTTLGTNRLALNFVALTDDAMGLAAFAGETGGDWALATAIYETATGTDGTLGLMSATIASAGTINGGSDTISLISWGVVGFALITNEPLFTQAAFRFYEDGTESGSTAIDTQDTNITRDVSGGDSNLQLRVRLQETNAVIALTTDDYQLQYELNDSASWENVDQTTSLTATYYFDGSDAAVTDPNNVWTNEANLTDSDATPSTFATTTATGSTSSNYMLAEGTNAPTSGDSITQVRARVFGRAPVGGSTLSAAIYTNTLGELLGTPALATGETDVWSAYATLSTPSGGWTWTKVSQLETKVYGTAAAATLRAYKVEVEVTYDAFSPGTEVIGFNSASLTDGNATTNRLGSGTGSFIAGEISEDGLVDNLAITASNYTELLYSLTIESTAVADNDTLDFRVLRNGATTGMTYTVTPRITIEEGGGTPLPSVSDTITITENRTVLIPELPINKSESITITENKPVELNSFVNKSDTVTVTEAVTVTLVGNINVNDSITITENKPVELNSFINKSESITVTENVAVLIPTLLISVSDSSTITENLKLLEESYISKSENATLTENAVVSIEAGITPAINVSDTITLTEANKTELTSYINVNETATISESIKLLPESYINVNDTATLTESLKLLEESYVNKLENITVTENAVVLLDNLVVTVSDTIALTENRQLLLESYVNKSETISLTENISLSSESYVTTSDTVSVTENINKLEESYINKSDTLTVTENVSVLVPALNISVSDTATISESLLVIVDTGGVGVMDNIAISENVQIFTNILYASVSESVSISENTQVGLLIGVEVRPDIQMKNGVVVI